MKLIPLTGGYDALVDDADFESVKDINWHAKKQGRRICAARNLRKPDGTRGTQFMHQFLMPEIRRIDHRDGNSLNNQRDNLRPASYLQNSQGHRLKKAGASSRYRGVCWHTKGDKWEAHIQVEGTKLHLGMFKLEEDAARAYNTSALLFFKEFATLNRIP